MKYSNINQSWKLQLPFSDSDGSVDRVHRVYRKRLANFFSNITDLNKPEASSKFLKIWKPIVKFSWK